MSEENIIKPSEDEALHLAVEIVSAYVSNNKIPSEDLGSFIESVHKTLANIAQQDLTSESETPKPAVSVRKSVTPDYLICLEDGKKLKMLKRYLRTNYGMTPEEYRLKWNLDPDYPMVAPNYAAQRSAFAKKIGLGRTGDKRQDDS